MENLVSVSVSARWRPHHLAALTELLNVHRNRVEIQFWGQQIAEFSIVHFYTIIEIEADLLIRSALLLRLEDEQLGLLHFEVVRVVSPFWQWSVKISGFVGIGLARLGFQFHLLTRNLLDMSIFPNDDRRAGLLGIRCLMNLLVPFSGFC